MSANNVVWYMQHDGLWHVWYSSCIDNTTKQPDFNNRYYKEFSYRVDAIIYAHTVVKKIDEEAYEAGFIGVEYGVCEVPMFRKKRNYLDRGKLEKIDKIINEWKQKIKDLQFSIEQFENWKEDLGGEKSKTGIKESRDKSCGSMASFPNSKLPDSCEECGGYRMGERMMHNDWCSQCTTSTTEEKLPKSKDCSICEHKDGTLEYNYHSFICDNCWAWSNWSPIKLTREEHRAEKKECKHKPEIRGAFEICKLCGYISPKRIKVSEGEKVFITEEGVENPSMVIKGDNISADSKLPEPKYIACRFCRSFNIKHEGWGNEHYYRCSDCKKKFKSPLEIEKLPEPEKLSEEKKCIRAQKSLDALEQIIKESLLCKELKQQIYEDILACRGMSYIEMVNYLVELEDKYDEK